MNFHILTLFPEMVENGLKTSIIGRAVAGGLLSIEAVNIRDFAFNKHQSVDDYPYGGGAGMLMQAEPVYLAYKDIEERIQKRIQNAKMQNAETEEQDAEVKVQNAGIQDAETVSPDKKLRVVYLSPQGKTFDQKMAEELAEEEDLVLLCGHYEGIDERVLEEIVTDYVSIGDYVLTGGELPAMVMVDTISRLVPGVLHNDVSAEFESFQDNLLEYPQYSRPEEWHGKKVPPVLLSGHHANIEKWRREQSILRTYERRPDLLEKSSLTWKEKKWLEDSGYMARVAFIMDKLLRKLGLSGRSIVPMLVGFGCTVPGVMASRTLPSERDRKMTILLTPFMSCTAKLPIYAFFSAVFFPDYAALVMIGLYVLGIVMGIIMALLFKGTMFKGEPVPFVMELPNYRLPGMKNVGQLLWEKAKDFLQRAFTVIFAATIVIWFLQSFDTSLNMVTDSKDSILAMIAGALSPVFAPLGFGDWRISTALVTGFMAKESVVSTLTVLFGTTEALLGTITAAGAAALLVFCLLYTPCVAAVASIKRELGGKWAFFVVIGQCVIAWLAAFAVHTVAMLF